ncbi:MAG: alpha/beta fold hydrolase [Gammaproteobacteria bacterium]
MRGRQSDSLSRRRASPTARLGTLAAFVFAAFTLSGIIPAGLSHAAPQSARAAATLLVGSIALRRCPNVPAFCGTLDRPMDPTGAIPGRISTYFEYYPHSAAGKSLGTLVATEGGPGYPATESRDSYLALFRLLRQRRDVLIMDNRGTGKSGAVDCRELQNAEQWTVEMNAGCGDSLGARAPLYGTAYAADDLAAILDALNIRRVDLYGDSYGTYFEQVFAVRHPHMLRSIVLDGAYPLNGPDYAWYPSYAPAMRDKFNIACRRFEPCASLPGTSIEHILPVLQELRAHPFPARAADSDGKEREFSADASQLAIVMFGGAPALVTVRELDAAARAFTDGDRAPLLRLMAETSTAVAPTSDIAKFSSGLATAVMCQDAPQIFDMRLAPLLRTADRDRAVADRKRTFPDTYAPFTIDEYRGMPLDYSFIDQCVKWPTPPSTHPASHVVADDAHYPDIPALIISGELDSITTLADGAAVAGAFKHGTQIRIANSFHVNALLHARSGCAAQITRRFVETLEPGDTRCAGKVAPVRLVPRFAVHAAQLGPAVALPGNRADREQLRWISAAVMTAGDVLARLGGNSTGQGVGLRGGTFAVVDGPASVHVTLNQVRWTDDLTVSGEIDKPSAGSGRVRATLHMAGAGFRTGNLKVEWPEGIANSVAAIHGTIDGTTVIARTAAP